MSTTIAPASGVSAPRLRVLSGSATIPGVLSATITTNNNRQAGEFDCAFALQTAAPFDIGWWSTQGQIRVTVQIGYADANGSVPSWATLLTGDADTLDIEPAQGNVRIAGRDLTALLIDQKLADTYQNLTASQIATKLADGVGLTPNVAATSTLVGRYYKSDHTKTTLSQFEYATTQWDLLVYLADQEGFNVWVDGTTLNFQPVEANSTPVSLPYQAGLIPQFGGMALTLHRAMTLAKNIEVKVRSWNSHSKKGFTITARGSIKTNAGAVVPLGVPQTYVFVRPNLTHAQAQVFAQQKLEELARHERVVEVTMPGDVTTNARQMVRLNGTGSSFDQPYYIDTITRSIDWQRGFVQTLRLKNHSPMDQTFT